MGEQLSHHGNNVQRLGDGRNVSGLFAPWKEHTVTERQAVELFRQFQPQEIADAISTHIFEQPVTLNYKTRPLEEYMQELQEPAVIKSTPYEITTHITEGRPDVYNLYHLYEYIVSHATQILVTTFPERFAEIIQQDSLNNQERAAMIQALGRGENMIALRLAFPVAFTPKDRRGGMQKFHNHLGIHDFGQIHDFTPDVLTSNTTPEMRLDAFVKMLAQPRTPTLTREDHQQALIVVCNQQGIDVASLPALKQSDQEGDRQLFSEIYKQAGLLLNASRTVHARTSLVGVFHNDMQEEQHGSIYTVATRRKGNSSTIQNTERGVCAGSDLHDALAQGIGLALLQNRDRTLNLIANPILQISKRQSMFHHDTVLNINMVEKGRAMYTTLEAKQRGKIFIQTQINSALQEANITPHYRNLLNELLTKVEEL